MTPSPSFVLYNSNRIRQRIRKILSAKKGRRVAVVAFVGAGADRFLPHPKGLELICWPQAGATDPNVLQELERKGVKIFFSERLHAKLYWSEFSGAVLGSANLTSNGLTGKGLHELAVDLPSDAVDINEVLRRISPIRMTSKALNDLISRTQRYRSKNRGLLLTELKRANPKVKSYSTWLKSKSRYPWRLFVYSTYFKKDPPQVKDILQKYGHDDWYDYWTATEGLTRPETWFLSVDLGPSGDGVYWSCANHRIKLPKNDPEFTPRTATHLAVQAERNGIWGPPPFKVDAAFSNRLRGLLRKRNVTSYESQLEIWPSGILKDRDLKALLP